MVATRSGASCARLPSESATKERVAAGHSHRIIAQLQVGDVQGAEADLSAAGRIAEELSLRQPAQLWQHTCVSSDAGSCGRKLGAGGRGAHRTGCGKALGESARSRRRPCPSTGCSDAPSVTSATRSRKSKTCATRRPSIRLRRLPLRTRAHPRTTRANWGSRASAPRPRRARLLGSAIRPGVAHQA